MAKTRTNQMNPSVPTELIIDRESFKKVISEQTTEGIELLSKFNEGKWDPQWLMQEYSAWNNYVIEYLKNAFNKPENEYRKAFEWEGYSSFAGRIGSYVNELEDHKDLIQRRINNLKVLHKAADIMRVSSSNQNANTTKVTPSGVNKSEVFIVHGHDEIAKVKTARFLEKLGLKPIILHEQASGGTTIIEKIEEYTNVGFALVLYTPCDSGKKKDGDAPLQDRARQNVVFEHGYLIARIGRNNVCALVKGNVETPSDISGVVYTQMDDHDAWHFSVAKELRKSGYAVDMNKI